MSNKAHIRLIARYFGISQIRARKIAKANRPMWRWLGQ